MTVEDELHELVDLVAEIRRSDSVARKDLWRDVAL